LPFFHRQRRWRCDFLSTRFTNNRPIHTDLNCTLGKPHCGQDVTRDGAILARGQNRRTATPFWLEAQGRPVGWPTLGNLEKAALPQRGYGQPRQTITPCHNPLRGWNAHAPRTQGSQRLATLGCMPERRCRSSIANGAGDATSYPHDSQMAGRYMPPLTAPCGQDGDFPVPD
jgi:hypothetical protein